MRSKNVVVQKERALNKVSDREFKKPPRKDKPKEETESEEDGELSKFNIKGQNHNQHKKVKSPEPVETEENQNEEEEEVQEENNVEEPIDKNKVQIDLFPREDYLKQKIEDLKINKSILKSVDKACINLKETIKKDIHIPNISQDIDIWIPKKEIREKWETKNSEIKSKERLHILNKWKHDQTHLENLLKQNIENAEVLKNNKQINDNIQKLTRINEEKERLIEEIDAIGSKINSLLFEEERRKFHKYKKNKLKEYIENFERDKEIVEIRQKKYENDSKTRIERIKTDTELCMEKRNREHEKLKQKWLLEKEEKWREFREKEKEAILKRTKENNQKLLKIKVFLNEHPQKNYLYLTNENEYIKKQSELIKSYKQARKEYCHPITQEDFEEYSNSYNLFKKKLSKKQKTRVAEWKHEWRERDAILPKYQNPILSLAQSQENDITYNKEQRLEIIKDLKEQKEKYAEEVKSKYKPVKDPKLVRERKKRILRIEHKNKPKKFVTWTHYRKNIIRLRKRNWNNPSKIKWKLKLDPNKDNPGGRNKSPFVKKLRYIKWSGSIDWANNNIKKKLKAIDKDYLNERQKSTNTNKNLNSQNNEITEKQGINWDRILNKDNKDWNIFENVNKIQMRIEKMENEVQRKEELLKHMGTGTSLNPQICHSMTNWMTEAIKGKLSLLNKIIHNNDI